ncbi:MAG: MgtC/SapB family protein [Bryobacterales bacterium]|nr:MgtC/SapB family protein [Bryobacterales bacterium]MBV9401818.1 MgtC/SapB family protein [Bryobacterales bacterium]
MAELTMQSFAVRFAVALAFGAFIGVERQWRQRMAGTRTNALVAGGAAVFVMSGTLVPGDPTAQGRIVSYVVSGVGFLGAGVIFKESAQVRGLNTAATIWCSAAVGVVTALGYIQYAAIVMAGVLLANTVLRPLAYKLHPPMAQPQPEEVCYHLELTCRSQEESRVRSLLLQTVNRLPCALYALRSEDQGASVLVDADLRVTGRNDEMLEQIVTRLSLEECVSAISWKVLPASGEHPSQTSVEIQEET